MQDIVLSLLLVRYIHKYFPTSIPKLPVEHFTAFSNRFKHLKSLKSLWKRWKYILQPFIFWRSWEILVQKDWRIKISSIWFSFSISNFSFKIANILYRISNLYRFIKFPINCSQPQHLELQSCLKDCTCLTTGFAYRLLQV